MTFFSKNTGSVEVIWDNDIYKIRFPILTHFNYLPKDTKFKFHEKVVRTTV